jgi:hypothetical protein
MSGGSTAAMPLDITKVPVAPHSPFAAANDVSIKLTTANDTLIQALFICHNEGEAACVGMFPQYGGAVIIKKLVEIICKQSKSGLFALDNNDAEMVGKELLKMQRRLILSGYQIVNVASLATLVNLTKLVLNQNQIINVAPLVTLVNLTTLYLDHNKIVDVAPLAELANLTVLHLGGNQIINVEPLTTLVHLTELDLSGNQIVNVAPLATLVNLTELYLNKNQIVDVAPLATLVNLKRLHLIENQIVDTTPLRSLPKTTKIVGVVVVRGGCCTIV